MNDVSALWERFRSVAAMAGSAPFVHDEDGATLAYRELAVRASATAESLLAALGSERGPAEGAFPRIAITCRRVEDGITALLGVALAGGTAVVLDALSPPDAIRTAMHDFACRWRLCDAASRTEVPAIRGVDGARGRGHHTTHLQHHPRRGVDDPFYVLPTTGTTGRAKGVLQSERNLLAHMDAYRTSIAMVAADRVTLLPALSTDAGFMDAFGALLSGATLLPWDVRGRGLAGIAAWLERERVTVLHATPSLLAAILAGAGAEHRETTVRVVVCGGEPLLERHLRFFDRLFRPGTKLVNGYGPTECTLIAQAHMDGPGAFVPKNIGRELPGIDVVIDADPGSEGASGEIVVLSDRLALGYVDDEVSSRFFDRNGRRAYRTGDRGSRAPDGTLRFEGRVDRHVKVNGLFVACAAVEDALATGVSARELYVDLDAAGDLCAWLVPASSSAPSPAEVRSAALERGLRGHEMPRRLSFLESLPRTASGKVDRRALLRMPVVDLEDPEAAPQDESQSPFERAARRALRTKQIDPLRSFFEQGGDSLGFLLLVAELESVFGHTDVTLELADAPLGEVLTRFETHARYVIHDESPAASAPSAPELDFWLSETAHVGLMTPRLHVTVHLPAGVAIARLADAFSSSIRALPKLAMRVVVAEDGRPRWEPTNEAPLTLERNAVAAEDLEELSQAVLATPLSCIAGPALRAVVFEPNEGAARLVLVVHHAYMDGIAVRSFVRAWFACYDGAQPHFITASRAALNAYDDPPSLQWWADYLRGSRRARYPSQNDDATRTPIERRACVTVTLGDAARQRLQRAGAIHGQRPFSVWALSFASAIEGCTGDAAIALATVASGRGSGVPHDAIGCFINTIYLRCELTPGESRRTLFARFLEGARGAFQRQRTPRQHVHERLGWRDVGAAVPNVYFSYHTWIDDRFELNGGIAERVSQTPGDLRVPLSLDVTRYRAADGGGEHFTAILSYDSTRIEPRLLERFREGLERELDVWSLVAAGDSERETEAYPSAWSRHVVSGSPPSEGADGDPVEAFLEHAFLHPDQIALSGRAGRVTYGALVDEAQRLATRLRALGLGPGMLAPVCSGDAHSVVVAWLGIWLTGGAFVTCSGEWPRSRLEALFETYGFRAVLTCGVAVLPPSVRQVRISEVGDEHPAEVALWPHAEGIAPGDVAYGCFTSGTTGVPRLALVARSGLANRLAWMRDAFGRHVGEIVVAKTTPFEYDSAIWQVLWPLSVGGTAVLPARTDVLQASQLVELIARERVTVIDFVPSVLAAIAGDLTTTREIETCLRTLRLVIIGGEQLQQGPVLQLASCLSGALVVDLYGTTEATIGSVFRILDLAEPTSELGRPIAGTWCAVVGDDGTPLPPRTRGQIVLGGACAGLGYFRDDDATQGRFKRTRDDPTLGRYVLTGDIGYIMDSGTLCYVGRQDLQVKRFGVRLNLAALDRQLERMADVDAACVVLATRGELVAFFTGRATEAEFQAWVQEELSAAERPARAYRLDTLPLTLMGKVDRAELTRRAVAADAGADHQPTNTIPARSRGLEIVRDVWRGLLGLSHVPPDASFFELGGHSLLALQAAAALTRVVGTRVSVASLFAHPTAEQLGHALDELEPRATKIWGSPSSGS
jgi:non-ribosomal peptide synthetase component F